MKSLHCCLTAGYEKLKMYGLYVHGCIDGGSNFVVYAVLGILQNARVAISACYVDTVPLQIGGHPGGHLEGSEGPCIMQS